MMAPQPKRSEGAVDVTRETPRAGTCQECGFDWTIRVEDAIRIVVGAPGRIAGLFDVALPRPAPAGDAGRWSPVSYVWHLVDVLRFGTERLWTLTLEPGAALPGWDQDVLAALRHYDELSRDVGLRALDAAVAVWTEAARAAPSAATVRHPVLGELTTADAVRRNAHEAVHHELDIRRGLAGT